MERTCEPLIHGLPDDIALLCLARIPRKYHIIVRCVSKRWRALLSSEEFLSCRQKHNLQETWIYAMCRDNAGRYCCFVLDTSDKRRQWKLLQGMPPCCLKREGMCFESLGRKLYFFGGSSWSENATNEMYCYDTCANSWEEVPQMPKARCYFVSAALDDTLYAIDGEDCCFSELSISWDTYNSVSKSWTSSQIPVMCDIKKCITLDRKIYTIHYSWGTNYAQVYDPLHKTWQCLDHENNEMHKCWSCPTVDVDGTLYMLDESFGTKLERWQKKTEDWVPFGRLSPSLTRPPCQLAAVGRKIYTVGRGLATVIVDVDAVAENIGVVVTSSTPPPYDSNLLVFGCKTISI